MIKSIASLLGLTLMLAGCNALQPEDATQEVVIGDCLNGNVINQATFGGPLRCGPQTEPVFTEVTTAPES